MREKYILPNGDMTFSSEKYISRWREMGHQLADLFEGQLHSYDPDFAIIDGNGKMIEISLRIGKKLIELMQEREKLRRRNSDLKKRLETKEKIR
jgi:hypothetical protein